MIALTLNEFLKMQGLNKKEFGLILGYPETTASQNVNKITDFIFVDFGTEWKVYSERKSRAFVLQKAT